MRAVFAAGSVLLFGCAYYNGMYNANRLARAAEKAEKEGRTFDANSLWGQVGVKADTVLARHGDSKWADDARLLRGKAYQRLGDCNSAVTVLRELIAGSSDSVLVEEGAFLMGRCYQVMGQVEDASQAFQRLVNSEDPVRRREARYQYGRSLRLGGRYDDALEFLDQSGDPRAVGERVAALAGAGRLDEAFTIAEPLLAAGDTAAPWDSVLSLVGRHDMARAGALLDRLVTLPTASPARQAGWLYRHGERLYSTDPDAGRELVARSLTLAPDGPFAPYARLSFLRHRMVQIETMDTLRVVRSDLDDMIQSSGPTGIQLGRYMRVSSLVLEAVDSARAGAPAPDLRLFLAAELARDSLELPRLAAVLFERITTEHAESPYAPKAWLALAALERVEAAVAREALETRYLGNPYTLAALGEPAPGFTALEDSLYKFAAALRRAARPFNPNARQQAPAPASTRLPEN